MSGHDNQFVQVILFVIGAFLELAGILMITAPDLVPHGARTAAWLDPRWRGMTNRLRRLVGLPPRGRVYRQAATVPLQVDVGMSEEVVIDPSASLEAKVEFLLRRNHETQMAVNALSGRLTVIERRLDDRESLEINVAEVIAASQAEYRPLRLLGTFALLAGLVCVTAASVF